MTEIDEHGAPPRTSARRPEPAARWLVATLMVGPLLVLASATLNHPPASDSAADMIAVVAAHRGAQLAEVFLELVGLVLSFVGCIVAARRVQARGRRLAAVGAGLCLAGIVGFTLANTEGLVVNALTGAPDRTAAVTALDAISHSPTVYVAFPLILLGEVGIVLVLAAFRRAHTLPIWPVLAAIAGVVVDFAGASRALLLVSDALVLVALAWLAATLARRQA
jgi:hypothetical protein